MEEMSKPLPVTMASMVDAEPMTGLEGQGNTFMTEAKHLEQTAIKKEVTSNEGSVLVADDSVIQKQVSA